MNAVLVKISNLSLSRIAVLGVILTLVYYFSFYDNGDSLQAQIESLTSQKLDEDSKKKDTEKILKREIEMRADVKQLAQTYEDVKSKIPVELTTADLRSVIEQTNKNIALKVLKIREGQPTNNEAIPLDGKIVDQVALEYSFSGNFIQISKFLIELASLEKIVKVNNFKLEAMVSNLGPARELQFETTITGLKQYIDHSAAKNTGAPP